MSRKKAQGLSTFSARLKAVREAAFPGHGGQTAFAEKLGIALTSYRRYEGGKVFPGPEIIDKMADAADVSTRWLRWGVGEKERKRYEGSGAQAAGELISDLWEELDATKRKLAEYEQKISGAPPVITVAPPNVDIKAWIREQNHVTGEVENCVAIPILGGSIAAGSPRDVFEEEIDGWAIFYGSAIKHPKTTSAVRVRGDSMVPYIPDGSLVGVDYSQRNPESIAKSPYPFAAVRDDEGGCVIRIVEKANGHWLFLPANRSPENRPLVWSKKDGDCPIVGKVVFASSIY